MYWRMRQLKIRLCHRRGNERGSFPKDGQKYLEVDLGFIVVHTMHKYKICFRLYLADNTELHNTSQNIYEVNNHLN